MLNSRKRSVFRDENVKIEDTPDTVQQAAEKGWTGIVLKEEQFSMPDPYGHYDDTYYPGWYGIEPGGDPFFGIKYICDGDGIRRHDSSGIKEHG